MNPNLSHSVFHINAENWPEDRPLGLGDKFCTLFATGEGADLEILSSRALSTLMDWGCRYFCCYGVKCEDLHDAIDINFVVKQVDGFFPKHEHIMTTWHTDTVDEAVFFWLRASTDERCLFGRHLIVTDNFDVNQISEAIDRL